MTKAWSVVAMITVSIVSSSKVCSRLTVRKWRRHRQNNGLDGTSQGSYLVEVSSATFYRTVGGRSLPTIWKYWHTSRFACLPTRICQDQVATLLVGDLRALQRA
ncbi:hypothetical protein PAXRUDRAFT_562565 [Paxillus rubicundulus Ve08.2h10]|uniref:Unplaced genomic scaffold scaffold_437, whole genome shotgun sequence n=1 Tax=Paxillus rubicundulus Ve08.2h10 TaxID=930991 RepID=A0A0D0DUE2_9AGAM|nr:hypothetical protein PAXRUDRAFT_562565 [Paxillus rubicundulus Ve08.2h10]